jgi:hypothetical protein
MKSSTWLVSLFLCFPLFLSAQYTTQSSRPYFKANRIEKAPIVDGNILSDPIWQAITPIQEFIQIKPKF